MERFRYAQFCPIARAAAILGQRWMLLVFRELFGGPQRFSDLRRRLRGMSSSVLAERLASLEEAGLVARRLLPPPSGASVYELTDTGRAFEPALLEITRWGLRLMTPPRPGEQLEPEWVRLGVRAFARRSAAPARRFELRMPAEPEPVSVRVAGGAEGTRVLRGDDAPVDAIVMAPPLVILGLLSGGLDPAQAVRDGVVAVEGDAAALADLPRLFDVLSEPDVLPDSPAADADASTANSNETRIEQKGTPA